VTWRKVRAGCYENGTHRVERDSGSSDEWDQLSEPEWFVYALPVRNDYGPPDAITEFETLREGKRYIDRLPPREGAPS
jgi:hypothetical protein